MVCSGWEERWHQAVAILKRRARRFETAHKMNFTTRHLHCGSGIVSSLDRSDRSSQSAERRKKVAHSVSCGFAVSLKLQPRRGGRRFRWFESGPFFRPSGARYASASHPQLTLWATVCRASGALTQKASAVRAISLSRLRNRACAPGLRLSGGWPRGWRGDRRPHPSSRRGGPTSSGSDPGRCRRIHSRPASWGP